MNWIFNLILIVCSIVGNNPPWASILIIWNSLTILYCLIPILRLDGYWLLSDLLGVPNLNRESRIAIVSLLSLRTPSINTYLHGTKQFIFYLYVILSVLATPYILYRIWLFMIWMIGELPLKLMAFQALISNRTDASIKGAIIISAQLLMVLLLLAAWGVNFIVPILQRITNILDNRSENIDIEMKS